MVTEGHPGQKLSYRPELDGLRGFAILLVMLAHTQTFPPQAGLVGVTAFFVLSGYLITRLLIDERADKGRIAIRSFYMRRAARLLPALAILILFIAAIGMIGLWSRPWTAGVEASLLYVGNWYRVLGIDLGPLGHEWSLAVEEQFYLVWPILFLLFRRSLWLVACPA